jgi:hypothetical protein
MQLRGAKEALGILKRISIGIAFYGISFHQVI